MQNQIFVVKSDIERYNFVGRRAFLSLPPPAPMAIALLLTFVSALSGE